MFVCVCVCVCVRERVCVCNFKISKEFCFSSQVGKHYRDPSAISTSQTLTSSTISRPPMTKVNHGKVDISKVSSRLTEAISIIAERAEIRVGDQVSVSGLGCDRKHPTTCLGVVRFVGAVDFVDDDCK